MGSVKHSPAITCFTLIALLICFCAGGVLPTHTNAQSERSVAEIQWIRSENLAPDWSNESSRPTKISPDLREQIETHVVGKDFETLAVKGKDELTRVVIQLSQPATARLNGLMSSGVVAEKGRF